MNLKRSFLTNKNLRLKLSSNKTLTICTIVYIEIIKIGASTIFQVMNVEVTNFKALKIFLTVLSTAHLEI